MSTSYDFDFLTGRWTVRHRKALDFLNPEAAGWQEFDSVTEGGTHFGGAAHFDEITMPDYTGLTLRLFDRETGEWSLYWADSRTGKLYPPVTGRFGEDGTGQFFGDDRHEGKPVRVRFVWSGISTSSARWEQAFSVDGGLTWITNWVMEFSRETTATR
ncbi:hypothetical protein ACIBI4_03880 [Streptomyces sp. NPDC050418]|uniref:hypothetical protein n=1 Tax=Streptomyces sp. NPDC050418 TaxID=3365612 RepID=UPI00378AFF79